MTLFDLAATVTMLSDDMKTILDWIKAQSIAPSAMPMEKSGLLSGTPPSKVRVTMMKGAVENTLGVQDNDDSDDDVSMASSLGKGRPRSFKVEIPNYDGAVNAKKLDVWLD